jgi:outer membrane immunogenic protein
VYEKGGSLKDGPVAYAPAVSWTGFYLGVNAGGKFGDTIDLTISDGESALVGTGDLDNTWTAGVHLGYNWQTARNVVLGIEGDLAAIGDPEDINDEYLATIRGRLGYAFDRTLVYATGGVAFLGTDATLSDDETLTGWAAGGGIEHKLRDNWSIGVEALYYAFEDDASAGDLTADLDRDFYTVKAKLSYHFGGDRYSEPLK